MKKIIVLILFVAATAFSISPSSQELPDTNAHVLGFASDPR